MKKTLTQLAVGSAFLLPLAASAQITIQEGSIADSLANILAFINATLIPFIIGIAFLFFVWGIFQYFIAGGANDDAKAKGKSLMIYATLGFVIIIVFWGLVNLIATGIGLEGDEFDYDISGPTL